MRLAALLETMGPYLMGQVPHAQAAQDLLGEPVDSVRGERLRVYGEFCRQHRFDAVDHIFPHTRSTVLAQAGLAAWEDLVERYFAAHPMHHFELNWNGRHLPSFLASRRSAPQDSLPTFLAELADLEWWEWQTYVAPDDSADADAGEGPLRVASTVELRPYSYDLLDWIEARSSHEFRTSPATSQTVILFWRDRDLDLRRAPASHLEMMILKAVIEEIPIDRNFAAQLGLPSDSVAGCLLDLHAAGILCGPMKPELNPIVAV